MKRFLPDWADPRVQQHERELQERGENDSADYTEQRRLDACYTRVLRKHNSCTATFFHHDEWSPRGLESHIDVEHAHRKRKAKLQSALSVLLLQARKEPQEEIARHYQLISYAAHIQAHRQGLLDELEAKHSLGDAVLNALKDSRRAKLMHSNYLRHTLQELAHESNDDGLKRSRKSRRFPGLFTV